MITKGIGSLFDSGAQALVNPVNCKGVMGGGLAREFAVRYPKMLKQYELKSRLGLMRIGYMDLFILDPIKEKYIINFPTKDHWKDPSDIKYIHFGKFDLIKTVEDWQIESVAVPALGCGLGGLSWDLVKRAIDDFDRFAPDVNWIVYEPGEK